MNLRRSAVFVFFLVLCDIVWFPSSPDVSRDEVEGNIRTLGQTKLTVSRGTTH